MQEAGYIDSIKKVKLSRKHKVSNSYGMNEAFLFFRKHRKDISSQTFRQVVKLINSLLQEQLAEGGDIHFPLKMGYLELRKFNTKTEFVDGKLKTNLPIDWARTLKLWYEDEESFKEKRKVRLETPTVFKVLYKKSAANYNNKTYYEFSTNRELKKALKKNISEGKVDAFTFNRTGYGTKIYKHKTNN